MKYLNNLKTQTNRRNQKINKIEIFHLLRAQRSAYLNISNAFLL